MSFVWHSQNVAFFAVIPCFLISFLTTFVFYLSDHKITFSISILVTLTVFFLVLIDLMPPTSLEVPMFGQYLITTMACNSILWNTSFLTDSGCSLHDGLGGDRRHPIPQRRHPPNVTLDSHCFPAFAAKVCVPPASSSINFLFLFADSSS